MALELSLNASRKNIGKTEIKISANDNTHCIFTAPIERDAVQNTMSVVFEMLDSAPVGMVLKSKGPSTLGKSQHLAKNKAILHKIIIIINCFFTGLHSYI